MTDPEPVDTDFEERRRLLEATRSEIPFVVFRDGAGGQRIFTLPLTLERALVGRRESSDIALTWDERASRVHAELERRGDEWLLSDDELSRNGTFVNGVRVRGSHRLRDGDVIRAGQTTLLFRDPRTTGSRQTVAASRASEAPALTEAQRRVLFALARPCLGRDSFATPATNEQIASELFLSVDAVKAHLRHLFRRFEVDQLPQIQKRTALVRIAIEAGLLRRTSPD